jgi:hypothetical protein
MGRCQARLKTKGGVTHASPLISPKGVVVVGSARMVTVTVNLVWKTPAPLSSGPACLRVGGANALPRDIVASRVS